MEAEDIEEHVWTVIILVEKREEVEEFDNRIVQI